MFDNMINNIQETTVRLLYHVRIEQKVEREQVAKVTGTNKDESGPKKADSKRRKQNLSKMTHAHVEAVKKYKQCCGRKRI